MAKYEELGAVLRAGSDPDISSPFLRAKTEIKPRAGANAVTAELLRIEKHVQLTHHAWEATWQKHGSSPQKSAMTPPSKNSKQESRKEINKALDKVRSLYAADIDGVVILQSCGEGLVDRLKASCAYSMGEKFANDIAFRDVCAIKASAEGALAPISRPFAEVLAVPLSFARLWAQS